MEVQSVISKFITEELLNGETVREDDNLLIDGMIDSVGVMRLVMFVEQTLDVAVPPEDFTIENFGSIRALSTYLEPRVDTSADS